ncbi:hypothetical protein RHS01_05624 [Rhizoctonia solani]|uniref:Uncharacterized protein n=1 Tax=Rhizoctonia solani TaxID=456999 RepID=A0A8H7IER5_9AGAM|nr:hypothetical protein RHS01_05624 [Rhizoctonia solani]
MPSTNKCITSLDVGHCTQARFILDFRTDEGRANAQRWYIHQGRNTRFTLLEYRKYKRGQVRHEFIVIWLNSTTLCRFDRRASDGRRGHILREEGTLAEDSAHVLSSFETEYKELLEQTEVLLSIKLPNGEDLGAILAVCEGIQTHGKASAYSLISYNCYFFSWMIVVAVARRTHDWETATLSKEGWDDILRISLTQVFPPPGLESKPTKPRTIGKRLSSIFTRSTKRTQNNIKSFTTTSNIERFQSELLSQYSASYDNIQTILQKTLAAFSIAERRATKDTVDYAVRKLTQEDRATGGLEWNDIDLYLRSQISQASTSAADCLTGKDVSGNWALLEDVWKSGWSTPPKSKELMRGSRNACWKEDPLARKTAEEWDGIGAKAMHKWKSAWTNVRGLVLSTLHK